MGPKKLLIGAAGVMAALGGCSASAPAADSPSSPVESAAVILVPVAVISVGDWWSDPPRGCFAPLPATVVAAAALDPPPRAMAAVPAFSDGQSGVWAVASDVDGQVSVTVVLTELAGGLVDEPLGHPQSAEPVCYHVGRDLEPCPTEWARADAAARACLKAL